MARTWGEGPRGYRPAPRATLRLTRKGWALLLLPIAFALGIATGGWSWYDHDALPVEVHECPTMTCDPWDMGIDTATDGPTDS